MSFNIRAGIVSSVDYGKGTVKVTLPDQDDAVTPDLPMFSYEYNMPAINSSVACLFLGNGLENGFCLGPHFSDKNLPVLSGSNIYQKRVLGEFITTYDSDTKTLTIEAENIVIIGDFRINGNLEVDGDITASGDITGNTPV